MNRTDWRAIGFLTALVLATSLPFIHRAYFVDDYYHVTMAAGLLDHPWRPYDFRSNDEAPGNLGWERGHFPRMVNPPLFHYFLACVMKAWGKDSWKLRLASLIFPIVSVIGMYFVGKRLVRNPLAAAILLAVTPAFWLTSYTLMIDSPLLAFFMMTLLTFMMACEKKTFAWVLVSGVVMGLTLLVKYFGILIVPVVFVWQWQDPIRRRWMLGYLPYLIAGLLLLAWGLWNIATYGQMHVIATLPRGFHGGTSITAYWAKLLVLGSFLSGSFIFLLAAAPLLYRRAPSVLLAILIGAAFLLPVLHGARGGFSVGQTAMLLVFTVSSVAFIALLPEPWRDQRFLVLWWAMGILELIVIMPWTAARYFLLVLPPSIWIFQKILEDTATRWLWPSVVALTALAGGSLAYADYAQANVIFSLARVVSQSPIIQSVHRKYFLGDTFTGYDPYLGPLDWQDAFPTTPFQKGDLLLVPRYRTSSWWKLPSPGRLHLVGQVDFPNAFPIRVMDIPASAGFYASVWGALPFAVTRDPLERFELYQVGADSQATPSRP